MEYMQHLVLVLIAIFTSLHVPAGACIPVATYKHCGAHKHIYGVYIYIYGVYIYIYYTTKYKEIQSDN